MSAPRLSEPDRAHLDAWSRAETALAAGTLPQVWGQIDEEALGSDLAALYRAALQQPYLVQRRLCFERLYVRWRSALAPPLRVYEAQREAAQIVLRDGQRLTLRQATRARAWGIAFGDAQGRPSEVLEARWRAQARAQLLTDLEGLPSLTQRLAQRTLQPAASLALGLAWEALAADLLDAQWRVRPATLAQDLLDGVDFWLKDVPGVRRRLPVQVGASLADGATDARHARKLRRAQQAGAVFISPGRLAAVVPQVAGAQALLPDGPPGVWARALRDRWQGALARPTAHPLGPMGALPAALRALVPQLVLHSVASAA